MGIFSRRDDKRIKELERDIAERKARIKARGGLSGIFESIVNDLQHQQQKFEQENFSDHLEWRETLETLVNQPSRLDDLSDEELEDCKITARSEVMRLEEARATMETGKWGNGQVLPSELPILGTLIERNNKLIAFINARQESRKKRPPQLPDKREQKQKREEDLYRQLEELKARKERLIRIETGGKPMSEWTEDEHRSVKKWENTIEAQEERIREELAEIWENL